MATEFKEILVEHVKLYFEPFLSLKDAEEVVDFFSLIGWDIKEIIDANDSPFYEHLDEIADAVALIIDLIDNSDDLETKFEEIYSNIGDLVDSIQELPNTIPDISLEKTEQIPIDLLNALLSLYLHKYQKVPYAILELLTIIRTEKGETIVNDAGKIIKYPVELPQVQWKLIPDIVSDPKNSFKEYYWPEGFDTLDQVNKASKALFYPLSHLFDALGFVTMIGVTSDADAPGPEMQKRMDGFISVARQFAFKPMVDESLFGLTLGLLPKGEGGPGAVVIPFGKMSISQAIKDWLVIVEVKSAVGGLQFTKNGVDFFDNPSQDAFATEAVISKIPNESGVAILVGNPASSHFSIEKIAFKTEIAVKTNTALYGLYAILEKGKLVIKGDDGDGFLSTVLGDGFNAEFDLEIGYSNKNGFHFKGSGDLEIVLPSHISLGPISIHNLTVGLGLQDKFLLKSFASLQLNLGPFAAVVEGIGLQTQLSLPENGGNLGPAQFDFGFKPPTGIGLSLDASVVKGGGYLFFEPEEERYGGAMELVIAEKISVAAVALITTRFPDGSKGFSLLLLISVEFNPGVALGMGFFLSGLGGMIGINRTANTDALRAGVKQGSVDHILFPTDVVANIQRIITDLREFFPPQRDQFIIGLMAKITWGVPSLLSVEFGIAIEFKNPVRLAILGVVKLVLPTEDEAIIRIQVNFIGVIDFKEGYLMFDASLFGSKLLSFTLEGDMALRIFWGKQKEFLLSVGGFHPAYSPPTFLKVANMSRLTLNILSGNPSLTLTTYFAITSNTVQFGALIDFYFKVSKFKVIGYFGFDVLFQFSPFRFIAGISAGVEVKLGSTVLFAIHLKFDLEGPTPWIASGKASFKVLFIKISVKFSKTWGERREDILPGIAVLPRLLEALEQPQNWVGELPSKKFLLTSLKKLELEEGQIIMHSVGTLSIRQTIMPLGMEISKFGNYAPVDINTAFISRINIDGVDSSFQAVKDSFAPAEFKEMEDKDKLSAPSYKDETSGAKITSTERIHLNYGINRIVNYELRVSDYNQDTNTPYSLYKPLLKDIMADNQTIFKKMAHGGAVGKSELSRELKTKSFRNEKAVSIEPEKFVITNLSDLSIFEAIDFKGGSRAEADDKLKKAIQKNPSLKNKLQIVSEYELM